MFAFFTMLYAISSVDADKLSRVVDSLGVAFDAPTAAVTTAVVADPEAAAEVQEVVEAEVERARELVGLRDRLTDELQNDIASELVDLRLDGRGLVLSLHEAGAFATGSADLSEAARELIAKVASSVQALGNAVRVEGHTDDVPIRTARYASNWELSTARATSVVTFLVEDMAISASRLSTAGYAEHRPRVPNDTAGNRAQNRRVDIVVLSATTESLEEPPLLAVPDP